MIMRDLVLELVGNDGFGLSPHLKRIAGQSRTVVGVDVFPDKCLNGLCNLSSGLLAFVGLVVVSGFKGFHDIKVVLLI